MQYIFGVLYQGVKLNLSSVQYNTYQQISQWILRHTWSKLWAWYSHFFLSPHQNILYRPLIIIHCFIQSAKTNWMTKWKSSHTWERCELSECQTWTGHRPESSVLASHWPGSRDPWLLIGCWHWTLTTTFPQRATGTACSNNWIVLQARCCMSHFLKETFINFFL